MRLIRPMLVVRLVSTLLGVAIFHHRTLQVALAGLAAIAGYQLFITQFPTGPGVAGLISHLHHEWVIIANLACLLLGFVRRDLYRLEVVDKVLHLLVVERTASGHAPRGHR